MAARTRPSVGVNHAADAARTPAKNAKSLGLAGCGKTRGQTDLSPAWIRILLIPVSRFGTDSSVPAFFRNLLDRKAAQAGTRARKANTPLSQR